MKRLTLEGLNSKQFLTEAFDAKHNARLERATQIRRNVYLWLFLIGITCIFIAALMKLTLLTILSLFLASIALVVMTKYDTQLFFLRVIKLREEEKKKK